VQYGLLSSEAGEGNPTWNPERSSTSSPPAAHFPLSQARFVRQHLSQRRVFTMTRRALLGLLGATATGCLGCTSKSVFVEYECFLCNGAGMVRGQIRSRHQLGAHGPLLDVQRFGEGEMSDL
jgi:hypothetical protein